MFFIGVEIAKGLATGERDCDRVGEEGLKCVVYMYF